MVRSIYVVSQKHFISPEKMISDLSNYGKSCEFEETTDVNKYEYAFDDYTGNFTDLLYWDTDIDLNDRTLADVLHTLSVAIARMKTENIEPKKYEPNFLLPTWWFGRERITPDSCIMTDLPDKERKSILLTHLLDMYDNLMKIDMKHETLHCYID